jgi:type I restriction enzyme M protein
VAPYRWQDWAAPEGTKRLSLQMGALGAAFFGFVNGELLPYLKGLRDKPNATPRQKVISEILSGVERVRVDTEKNFLDVLDKVHEIRHENIDTSHIFALSQVYEGLLLKMGEKGNDGGQFFTPRQVIRVKVKAVNPQIGQTLLVICEKCGQWRKLCVDRIISEIKFDIHLETPTCAKSNEVSRGYPIPANSDNFHQ